MCAYVKFLTDVTRRTFGFLLQSANKTAGFYERYPSRSYYRVTERTKICYKTGAIKN